MCASSENKRIFCNLYSGIPESSKSWSNRKCALARNVLHLLSTPGQGGGGEHMDFEC